MGAKLTVGKQINCRGAIFCARVHDTTRQGIPLSEYHLPVRMQNIAPPYKWVNRYLGRFPHPLHSEAVFLSVGERAVWWFYNLKAALMASTWSSFSHVKSSTSRSNSLCSYLEAKCLVTTLGVLPMCP